MALDLEKLRAAVNERKVEEPAFTEADLEAEKARLRGEIDALEAQSNTEEEASGLNLNNLRLNSLKDSLRALEEGGLEAMLTREQQEERVATEFNASMFAKYDGKKPNFEEEE